MPYKIGMGYDVHKLVENRELILGGIKIPHTKGLLGHSDADVLLHSITDSLLGALGKGDIGTHFPDTDNKYKNISSMVLLKEVYNLLLQENYSIVNIDCVIIAEKPKLLPYINFMKENISSNLKIEANIINIKATTEEGLGFTGLEEGIGCKVVVLIKKTEKYKFL